MPAARRAAGSRYSQSRPDTRYIITHQDLRHSSGSGSSEVGPYFSPAGDATGDVEDLKKALTDPDAEFPPH